MEPITYNNIANCQSPCFTIHRAPVPSIPKKAKVINNFFFAVPLSAMAPRKGAKTATIMDAMEFASPRYHVLKVTLSVLDQYSLKKTGKNPAMTVVAKALLAQS